jgi:nucleotide-binding universal stress UspA family protein
VDLVAAVAWPDGTAVRVVQAIDLGPGLFGGPWPTLALSQVDELETALHVEARRELEAVRARLEAPGRSVTTAVLDGRAASEILDEAAAWHADLVVVGSRGHGTIASMVLGSVSSEVVDHANVPVLVARHGRLDRLALAWDGSACAAGAAEAVRTWPILAGAAIRVVTVADVGMPWWAGFADVGAAGAGGPTAVILETADAARSAARTLADEMVASLAAEGRTVRADHREGDAATEIIAGARADGCDLIVMGTHGRTGLARLALGSVADNVVRHASCSVLVVRATSQEASSSAP